MVLQSSSSLLCLFALALWGSATSFLVADARLYENIEEFAASSGSISSFDFVVVGGGTAGSVIAGRLSENPNHRVLLLEAGPNNEGILDLIVPNLWLAIPPTYDWNFTTVPQPNVNNRSIPYRRGFALGGSSSVNSMIYTRGSRSDYDLWGRLSEDSKTWSWDGLKPWILKHETWTPPVGGRDPTGQYDPRYHGTQGPLRVTLPWSDEDDFDRRVARNAELQKEFEVRLDINDGNPTGLSWCQYTFGGGERNSAATAYLGNLTRERRNLDIVVNVHAKRVIPTVRRAQGRLDIRTVEVGSRFSDTTVQVTAGKEVVLSAGAFGTPHILLSSGIGEKSDLDSVGVKTIHHLPDVGKGLVDHVMVPVVWGMNGTAPQYDRDAALEQWMKDRTGPMSEWYGTGKHILWSRLPDNSPLLTKYGDPASGPLAPHIELPLGFPVESANIQLVVLLTPHSRGTVKLASSNPFDAPLVDPNYLSHPFDMQAMKEGIRIAKRWYTGPAWDGLLTEFLGPDPDNSTQSPSEFENAFKAFVDQFGHPVGTAAMSSPGSNKGVVDNKLKVKGVDGLRVVDASAIPYVPTAHTQASVYILAERAADIIKSAWT